MPKVTREQAWLIAEAVFSKNDGCDGVSKVCDWNEITCRKPLEQYCPRDLVLPECWIVYANLSDPLCITSSIIAAVHKETGEVVFHGDACDEG